jgi:phosphoribosylformylglycinamidine synthase subunit PurL
MVQTNTVQGPGGEAGVMRIKGTGTPGHERGLAMALAGNGRWCYLDPKLGAMHAVAEAARKVACTGATPVAATNCLNFGNPEKPEIMAQLSAAIDGIAEACTALGTPITGGNVSLYNETKGEGIYPTPVVGIVGILDDVTKAVPASFVQAGDAILLLCRIDVHQETEDFGRQFGASEFARTSFESVWGTPPDLDLWNEGQVQRVLQSAARSGLLRSACDIADGGLAVALAKASIASGLGCKVEMSPSNQHLPRAIELFGEEGSVVVATCSPGNIQAACDLAEGHGLLGALHIGTVGGNSVDICLGGERVISASLHDLDASFSNALQSQLAAEVTA